jgi:hypothetical protein
MTRPLAPHHYQMLSQESGISDEVMTERGYYTATTKVELEALGFTDFQRCAPALVLPVHDVHGRICTHQIRPDTPRRNKKKLVKYDTPQGSQIALDVHPLHRSALGQAAIPLVVIEGLKKADSMTSRVTPDQPLCVVGMIGVYGWMRSKQPLPEWRQIPLQQREVLIVFDSDVTSIPEVGQARSALAHFLAKAGAHVKHIDLPPLPQGKCGADDYFVAGHTLEELLALTQETFPQPQALITTLADVDERPVEWFWEPYLPKGALTMVDGDPGTGKSLWSLQLAASLSKGWPLPDQVGTLTLQTGQPRHTLLIAAEDSISATIKKRCRECGGDDSKIQLFSEWKDGDGTIRPFTLQNIALLDEELARRPYALIVIDPIQAFLGDIDMHRSNETRPVLQALSKVLERHNVTGICVRHPSKPGQGSTKAIYRGLGSIDFIGCARSGLFIEQHPVEATKVLLAHAKSNVGPLGRTQVFSKEHGVFEWAGVSRVTAEMIAGNARGPDPAAGLEAVFWLEARLKGGLAWPANDLQQEADEADISKKSLYAASKRLGIVKKQTPTGWTWRLPPLSSLTQPSGASGFTGMTGLTGRSEAITSANGVPHACVTESPAPPDPPSPDRPDAPEDPDTPVSRVVEGPDDEEELF